MKVATFVMLGTTSILLFAFGVNLLFLSFRALRMRRRDATPEGARTAPLVELPRVCVQLPIYNERYVAQRVLDAVCAMDWPRDRLEVQVLDDSDDETVQIIERRVEHWRRRGIDVAQIRRDIRTGFKAGALAYGCERTTAPFLAIFDADFVPPPDFLRRTVPEFEEPKVAFVQARWGHLDENYSWFTRLQALFIDFHFLVEQAVRSASGYLVNFTGTAGIWRRDAIQDAGGWTAETLTEDLDLSYRAQLRGWRAVYLEDLVVPEELPVSIDAYRNQQSRWATGSFQCAQRLLGPVWASDFRFASKLQATIHLLAYGVGPLMLVQLICYPALLLTVGRQNLPWQIGATLLLGVVVAGSPWIGFMVAQSRRGRPWWTGLPSVLCQVIGAGMSINVMLALFRSLRPGGTFVRTPKHHIVRIGQEWRDQAYVRVGDPRALLEAGFGVSAGAIVPFAVATGQPLLAIYSGLFSFGFLTVAALSLVDLVEVFTLRRLGRRALRTVRMAAPAALIFAASAAVLLLAAQLPEPFEDGYGHWLLAANLASTGHLHDPLFGMEDTWLPGYHLLAAGVLSVFGLWQLSALKAMSAIFGAATAACVYALAPNVRQARLASALLVLNPVFLFTSGSAVVEPALTAMTTGAALAAVRGRFRIAAALAAAACATSTKAWILVGTAAAIVFFDLVRSRAPSRPRTAAAWMIPSLAILILLPVGFGPASHSVTRGAIEVMSATARGSLPAGAAARVLELTTTYGLAAIPLIAFGVLGIVGAGRRHPSGLWRFVYAPAIVYLVAVFGLVAIGVYSGSHRYLYPALPAMALLAAAALDRYSQVIRLATVGANAMLAVGFLPVFLGFAADNAGLVAAGHAAAGRPGALLTDSPVVAYYSGKLPWQITGSQALPANRIQAIEWLHAHQVSTLVVEDISYYRSTQTFPDLAQGSASPPFGALGLESRYQVTGGKSVYAYQLDDTQITQWINSDLSAEFWPMPAEGKTAGLGKGMALQVGATSVAGEGMGFGVPIIEFPDGWVYPRTVSDTDLSTPAITRWRRTFELNEMGGDAAHRYAFTPIASRGEIQVLYQIDGTGISITVKPVWLAGGHGHVAILNEQSSLFDDFAAAGQPTLIGDSFGNWVPVTGSWARLRSGSLGVEWSLPAIDGASLFAGRELSLPDFNWAGLDYMFPATFDGAAYHITVQEAR